MTTYITLGLLVISFIMTYISQTSVDKRFQKIKHKEPLNDIAVDYLPNLDEYDYICDYLTIIPVTILAYICWKNNDLSTINNFILYFSVIFILRSITVYFTLFPSLYCHYHKSINSLGGCCDCLFSGHTATTLLSILFLINLGFPVYTMIYPLFVSLMIIASKSHYTADVIVSWYITFLVYISIKYKCVHRFFEFS